MSLSKCLKRKRTTTSFKSGWLEEVVETESTQSECTVGLRLKIREIFSYGDETDDSGVVCLVCHEIFYWIEESNRKRYATVQM